MTDISKFFERATALRDKGDLEGAVDMVDHAIARTKVGHPERQQALQKRIHYLIVIGRLSGALKSADQMIAEIPSQARGDEQLTSVLAAGAYQQRARVYEGMGERAEAFLDSIRSEWEWHHAMVLQGQEADCAPAQLVALLGDHALKFRVALPELKVVELTRQFLTDPDGASAVARFRYALVAAAGSADI